MSTSGIFISYRKADTPGYAGRLHDRLKHHFGSERVFLDAEDLRGGVEWRKSIEDVLGQSSVLLVLIGRQWLAVTDDSGNRRLDDPADVLTSEISAAFDRDVYVIPVLVQGASMPRIEDLPEPLKFLPDRQFVEIRDDSWDDDVRRLVGTIEERVGKTKARKSSTGRRKAKRHDRPGEDAGSRAESALDGGAVRISRAVDEAPNVLIPQLVGVWELQLPSENWVVELRPDGSFSMQGGSIEAVAAVEGMWVVGSGPPPVVELSALTPHQGWQVVGSLTIRGSQWNGFYGEDREGEQFLLTRL